MAMAPLAGHTQSLAYSNAVMSLSPVAYWPMHETNAAAPGDIETNLGTLGNLANGYYNDWSPGNLSGSAQIYRQFPGPFTNAAGWPATPIDYGIEFSNSGPRSSTAPYMLIPNVSPLMQLKPPFTIEWWANANYHQYGQFSTMLGPGVQGFNDSPNDAGFSLNWNNPSGENGAIFNVYAYGGVGGNTISGAASPPTTLVNSNQWYYFAWVYTANNTTYAIANGGVNGPDTASPPLNPALWSPFWIGNGRAANTGPAGFSFDGAISEVAIYTNALSTSDLLNHYAAGTNAASTSTTYSNLVMSDSYGPPVVYLRMDSPGYTAPAVNTWPMLNNYGSAAGTGVYTPGTFPGILTGSTNSGYPINVFTNQVALLSAMGTFADAGSAVSSACNPTGTGQSFTITAMFRGNPADPRTQSIVGHGTNSWELGLATNGMIVFNAGNGGAAQEATGTSPGDMRTVGVYNDGYWHQVVAVDNANAISIYVDGVLDTNGTPAGVTGTSIIPGNGNDVLIGADPSYTNANVGIGRQFSGQICEVAFFNSALTASQAQNLYNTGGEIPVFKTQPHSVVVNAAPNAYTNITVVALGSQLAYQWFFNSSSNYSGTALTDNTYYSNVTTPQLTVTNLLTLGNGYYYVVATSIYGSITSSIASLTIETAPQVITQFPITYNNVLNTNYMMIYAGANPAFSVSAAGAVPLSYHWFTNGVAVGGATNAGMTLTNVLAGTNTVFCVVTNIVGSVTSLVWSASVITDPTNSTGGLAPYPQQVLALKPIAYWRLNDYLTEGENQNGDNGFIAYDYAGGNDGLYTNVYLQNSGYNPITDPSDSSVEVGYGYAANSDANFVGTNIDFSLPAGSNAEFSVECWVNFNVNTVCGIVTKGYGDGGEEFTLDCDSAGYPRFIVRVANGSDYTAQTPTEVSEGAWYHLVGVCDEANGVMSLYVNGQLAASSAIPTGGGVLADVGDNLIIGARSSSLLNDEAGDDNNQTEGYINDVAVFNYALNPSQVAAEYSSSGIRPSFIQQPIAATNIDQNGTLSASAVLNGSLPLSYQWYETNLNSSTGFPLLNQTNLTLVINDAQTNDDYFLSVTNAYGATNSSVVAVTVITGLNVTMAPPTNVTLYAGYSNPFTVDATGTLPFSYQWYQGASAILNATNASYTAVANSGTITYSCTVTNIFGSTNLSAWLTAIPMPTNRYQATVLGNHPIAYWRLNEGPDNQSGDNGVVAYDYAGGHDGTYNNAVLGFQGFDSATSTDTAALFGVYAPDNSYMGETDESTSGVPNINFGGPAVANAEFSVECWVDVTNDTGGAVIAKGYGNGGEQFCIDNGANGSTAFRFFVRNAAGTAVDANSSIAPVPGTWYYLAGVCDETNSLITLYVDGVSAATAALAQGSGLLLSHTGSLPAANLVSIGSRSSSQTATTMTLQNGGLISQVALYNYPLSAAQVGAHYQASGLAISPVSLVPTNIVSSVTNNLLYLSWPANHIGWQLQAQTNSLSTGISTNWVDYNPSTTTNQVVIPINLTNGTVFFRLIYTP